MITQCQCRGRCGFHEGRCERRDGVSGVTLTTVQYKADVQQQWCQSCRLNMWGDAGDIKALIAAIAARGRQVLLMHDDGSMYEEG